MAEPKLLGGRDAVGVGERIVDGTVTGIGVRRKLPR